MRTDQLTETITSKETLTKEIHGNELEMPVCFSAGEACTSGQEGHESTDPGNNHILRCTQVGPNEYVWKDTGRIRS